MGYPHFLWERDGCSQKSSEGGVKVFAHDSAFGEKGERQDQKLNTEEAFRRCSSK